MGTSKQSRTSRTDAATAMEIAAHFGLPSPVRQADNVCVHERNRALTDINLTSRTKTVSSSFERERKTVFTAGSANRYRASADSTPAAAVIPRENSTRLNAPDFPFSSAFFSLANAADTAGTLAAAIP